MERSALRCAGVFRRLTFLVDARLVIVEPTPRSIDVGKQAVLVATEGQQDTITVVPNKVLDDEDSARVREAFADHDRCDQCEQGRDGGDQSQ